MDTSKQYIDSVCDTLQKLNLDQVSKIIKKLEEAWIHKRQVLIAGNGGSAATASHMANDLIKTVTNLSKTGVRGFRAMALNDNTPVVTAIANDISYDQIFSEQLKTFASPQDLLIVITGSGNSKNIIALLEEAKKYSLLTIGILGKDGGRAKSMVDLALVVPSDDYGPIEDIHMILNHLITDYFKNWLSNK